MNGNVFQCHGEKVDRQQFIKTVKALEEHINKTFEFPQDIALICTNFSLPTLSPPPNLSAEEYKNDMAKKMIWETKMKTYLKGSTRKRATSAPSTPSRGAKAAL